MKTLLSITLLLIFISCRRVFEAPVPDTRWDLFNSSSAQKLSAATRAKMEGIYSVASGADAFGNMAAAKWSYTVDGADTTYHFSFFFEKNSAYFILEGRRLDSSILLNGYWRRMVSTETGKVRLVIAAATGAKYLLGTGLINNPQIILTGNYGNGESEPNMPLEINYQRRLNSRSFEIIAHRGGGRTADLLPASENTVEIIRLASRLGATGVEIDVRLTKDGVPVLYHDETLNERLVQQNGLLGPIENYSYAQLHTLVRLTNGEKIPTLRDALQTIVYYTPLRFVWIDIKYHGSLQQVRALQQEFTTKAATISRTVEIAIGIPDQEVQKNFLQLSDYRNVLSVNEQELADVAITNSKIWGPNWTRGLMSEEVQQMHAQSRRAFAWTLDISENIKKYMIEGNFDGILSNYPSLVAYHHYVRQ